MIVTAGMVAAVAVLIYLVDCVVLVARGQGVLEAGWPGASAKFGSRYYTFKDRPVVLLNPFTPWRVAMRSMPVGSSCAGAPIARIRALRGPAAVCTLQALLVLVAGPVLLHYASGLPFLAAVAAAFVIVALVGAILWRRRAAIDLSGAAFANLVVSALVCLPLSINMARKAALANSTRLSPSQILRFVRGSGRDGARADLVAQLEEARLAADPESDAGRAIDRLLRELHAGSGDVGR